MLVAFYRYIIKLLFFSIGITISCSIQLYNVYKGAKLTDFWRSIQDLF